MAELCPLQDLPQDSADCVFVQTIGTLLQLVQNCVVHKLKDQVQPLLPPEHLNQIHQVVVPQLLKHPDFAESDFLDHLIILALQELFDGHQLTGLFVATLEHHPIAALPHQTQVLILLHRT